MREGEILYKGELIIIGGAEDKEHDKEILKEVANGINKEEGLLVVATIATEYPEMAANKYKKVFSELGIKNIEILDISNREDAFKDRNIEVIKKSALIFFTGGDQLRITSLIGGTPTCVALKEAHKNGCKMVGTSAGASVMTDTMIVEGNNDDSPRKCTLKMSPGLGFLENVIIDQHFAQRGRIGRLLTGIAQNPEVLGIGIDEDTAIVVNNNNIRVIGSGAVYFIDGRDISYTNVSEQNSDEILSIFNVKLHVLKKDNKFNLDKRAPFEEESKSNEDN